MEDLISRQVVLDLAEWFRINQQHFTVDNLIDEVENIPSVTPKPNPVHWIDEAKLLKAIDTWDKFGVDDTNSLFRLDNLSLPHYVPYMRYDDVIKCIKGMPSVTPKQKMGRWIPCSERLPDYGVSVLTWDGYCYCVEKRIPYIRDDGGEPISSDWWVSDEYDEYESDYYPGLRDGACIAWMPLPEPYRAESEYKESE